MSRAHQDYETTKRGRQHHTDDFYHPRKLSPESHEMLTYKAGHWHDRANRCAIMAVILIYCI